MHFNYQRPRRLEIEDLSPAYGKFSAEPFERGYGTTIGIALRRVLLSLIEGASVSAVRIDGVLHEFSVIPGIYEDVLNIILNIKNIPFKLDGEESRIVRIQKEGPGEVLSSDIEGDGSVEVLDKKIHIAYLEEKGKFQAEIQIKKGVGFRVADLNFDETLPIDFIPVDANFNPIEKVNYSIQPARVGKTTDYEKLVMEIWTNGSLSPKTALTRAGKILRDHLAIFLDQPDFEKIKSSTEADIGISIESKADILEKTVETLGLSVRALKCLKRLGVDYIYELVERTEHELLNSKNFGKKSLEEIIHKLSEFELNLGQKLPDRLKEQFQEKYDKTDEKVEMMEETEEA